jgi:transcriptional regulator GlxA family with amidase domain
MFSVLNMNQPMNVAILIFDDVEVLDFCGPYEVFGVTGGNADPKPFQVYTVAAEQRPILARNQLSVNPKYSFADCPQSDILLIPGGYGTRPLMNNSVVLDWIKTRAETAQLVLSVCTGALLLAKIGLLDGLAATTHHLALDLLREVAPNTEVRQNARVVDNGKIILSAGISAGIDMSLYVVAKLLGKQEAIATAQYMEYDWRQDLSILQPQIAG